MTYVELIVVLSIFAVLSSVVIFNYRGFQERVDIKSLTSDIALKVVEAQKSSLSGRLPAQAVPAGWKPSYGVYFNTTATENKKFLYFTDTTPDLKFNGTDCTGECLSKYTITRNNYIKDITEYRSSGSSVLGDLSVTFVRPDSRARIVSAGAERTNFTNVTVTVSSPGGATSKILFFPSGRIEVQ